MNANEQMTRRKFLRDARNLAIGFSAVGIGLRVVADSWMQSPSASASSSSPLPTPPHDITPTSLPKENFLLPTDPIFIRESTIEAVDGKQSLTADQVKKILQRNGANPALIEAADAFVKYGKEYGIDGAWGLAFCLKESDGGTEGVATETKSIGNLGWTPDSYSDVSYGRNRILNPKTGELEETGRFRRYNSWEDGIKDYFALLKKGYVEGNIGPYPRKTPDEIIPKYAPSFENDVEAYITDTCTMVGNWRKEFDPKGITISRPVYSQVEIQKDYHPVPINQLVIDQYTGKRNLVTCEKNCGPTTIILHYTGGTDDIEPDVIDSYQFSVGFNGEVQEGSATPEANAPGPDGTLADPAWHTMFRSGKSLGIAIRGMAGTADGRDCTTSPSKYPITPDAFEAMCMLAALEAKKYGIDPTDATILTHNELTQLDEGKKYTAADGSVVVYDSKGEHYDLGCLSFVPGYSQKQVKQLILERVLYYYHDTSVFFENPKRVKLVKAA